MRAILSIVLALTATAAVAQDYGVGEGINTFLKMRQYREGEHNRRETERANIAIGKSLMLGSANGASATGATALTNDQICSGNTLTLMQLVANDIIRANPSVKPAELWAAVQQQIKALRSLACAQ